MYQDQVTKARCFDSAAELADFVEANAMRKSRRFKQNGSRLSWFGGFTYQQSLTHGRRGAPELLHYAEPLALSLSDIRTPKPTWEPSPQGAFPVVPQAIIGDPNSMRRRVFRASDSNPVRIFYVTTLSAGLPAELIAKRGAAVVILANRLGEIRPVELVAVVGCQGKPPLLFPVGFAPLNLSAALGALASPGFTRYVTYDALDHFYPHCTKDRAPISTTSETKNATGASDHDLCIPGAHLKDELSTNPRAFIERTIKQYAEQGESNYA